MALLVLCAPIAVGEALNTEGFAAFDRVRSSKRMVAQVQKLGPDYRMWVSEGSAELLPPAEWLFYSKTDASGRARFVYVMNSDSPYRRPPSFPGKAPEYLLNDEQLEKMWVSSEPVVYVTDPLRPPEQNRRSSQAPADAGARDSAQRCWIPPSFCQRRSLGTMGEITRRHFPNASGIEIATVPLVFARQPERRRKALGHVRHSGVILGFEPFQIEQRSVNTNRERAASEKIADCAFVYAARRGLPGYSARRLQRLDVGRAAQRRRKNLHRIRAQIPRTDHFRRRERAGN